MKRATLTSSPRSPTRPRSALRTSRSIRSLVFSLRSRFSSLMSSTDRPLLPSRSARSWAYQWPSVPTLIARSRATCVIGFPVSRTIHTAPSRNSWSYFLRFSDMTTPHSACLHGFGGGSLIEREIRTSMKTQGLAGIPLYPELRNCPAPSAPRILDIFNDVKRHHLISGDQIVQTFQPQLTPLQQQVLELLNIPASISVSYTHLTLPTNR